MHYIFALLSYRSVIDTHPVASHKRSKFSGRYRCGNSKSSSRFGSKNKNGFLVHDRDKYLQIFFNIFLTFTTSITKLLAVSKNFINATSRSFLLVFVISANANYQKKCIPCQKFETFFFSQEKVGENWLHLVWCTKMSLRNAEWWKSKLGKRRMRKGCNFWQYYVVLLQMVTLESFCPNEEGLQSCATRFC